MPAPRSSRAPRPSVAAAPAEEIISRLEAVAAELRARGWTAHLAATPPHRPPQLFAQDPGKPAARGHILAAPDDATGQWWYWDDAQRPIAAASKPAAAADQIIEALTGPGRRVAAARGVVNRPVPGGAPQRGSGRRTR